MSGATIGAIVGTVLAVIMSASAHYRATMAQVRWQDHSTDPAAHTQPPPK